MELNRRDMLTAAAALAALPARAGAVARSAPEAGYFLSSRNPVATADEAAVQPRLLGLWTLPAMRAARDRAAFLWQTAYGVDVPDEAKPSFDAAMDEYAFNYLIKAAISDGGPPRVLRNFMPAARWLGHDVPGARIGGDNPDNCYRMVAIAGEGRYRLRATPVGIPPSSATYTLMANYGTSKTIQTLSAKSARRTPDGSFSITIDSGAAPDGTNHLRSNADAKLLFIRDSLGDWNRQTPYAIEIERLDPPPRRPLDDREIVERAAAIMADDVPLYYWFVRLCTGRPVNRLFDPLPSGRLGGLLSQAGSQGRLQLQDDEAAIVTLDPAGADYVNFVLHDTWFRTIDYWKIQSSLTNAQLKPEADGRYTIVVSSEDPGVHNWADTGGLRNTLLVARWQGLPDRQVGRKPALSCRIVKLRGLDAALPAATARVTVEERRGQLELRRKGFARRLEI